jgi:hypothetical protein
MPQAEADRIKAHNHELIGGAVLALHKRCANHRYNAPRQNSQQAGWQR